jgi:hypothetical protein
MNIKASVVRKMFLLCDKVLLKVQQMHLASHRPAGLRVPLYNIFLLLRLTNPAVGCSHKPPGVIIFKLM